MFAFPLATAVTLFAVAVYFGLGMNVGRARIKYKVMPPATEGPPEFARRYRAHQNTLEQLPPFVVVLWLAAFGLGDGIAAAIGVFWPIGRILYAAGYYRESTQRLPGFLISALSTLVLWFVVAGALVWQALAGLL